MKNLTIRAASSARRFSAGILWLAAILLFPIQLPGHADIHERIKAVSEQIEKQPNDAELYIKRGELHRMHRDWKAALADYQRAVERDPHLDQVKFVRGRMQFEAGRWTAAKTDLDQFLALQPNHREGLLVRARVLAALGKRLEAVKDYTQAIAMLAHPTPEYYLERAKTLEAEGDEYIEWALRGLDEGIAKLGPLVTLQFRAIDLELKRRRYDEALARLDQIARWLSAERRLQRRGEILELAGRRQEARRAYSEALDHLESLPARRGTSQASRELEEHLRASLERLRPAGLLEGDGSP